MGRLSGDFSRVPHAEPGLGHGITGSPIPSRISARNTPEPSRLSPGRLSTQPRAGQGEGLAQSRRQSSPCSRWPSTPSCWPLVVRGTGLPRASGEVGFDGDGWRSPPVSSACRSRHGRVNGSMLWSHRGRELDHSVWMNERSLHMWEGYGSWKRVARPTPLRSPARRGATGRLTPSAERSSERGGERVLAHDGV